jgi:hypothetical protein
MRKGIFTQEKETLELSDKKSRAKEIEKRTCREWNPTALIVSLFLESFNKQN